MKIMDEEFFAYCNEQFFSSNEFDQLRAEWIKKNIDRLEEGFAQEKEYND